MIGHGNETPSRSELLRMVKKHSKLLGKTVVDDEESSDVEMDQKFWRDVVDSYFFRSLESRTRQDDDLVFFVRKLGFGSIDEREGESPYFVRRWASKLDEVVGESSIEVDWRRSFYLNLIAHTSFTVTVAICSHEELINYQAARDKPLSPIYKVVKTVYASPSRINFHLDSRKEAETKPAYPEICFAVDDFDATFDAVVLTESDHCYCVLLNAHSGAAFPSENEQLDCSSSNSSSIQMDSNSGKAKNKLTLFSGFVSYQMVRDAYYAGKSRFGSLLALGNSPGKTDRLYMKGPGGRGEVEVAVSGVADQSQIDPDPFSPEGSKRGFGFGSIVRKAAAVATLAARHAYAAAASSSNFDEEILELVPLKCCLMSISLPWEHIANDLLFKGSPPVNL